MPEFRKSDPPPPATPALIWKAIPGKFDVILLGSYLGKWVHWTGKRNVLCEGDNCPANRHRMPIRWLGYYPAVISTRSKEPDPKTGRFAVVLEKIVFSVNPEQQENLAPYNHFPLLVKCSKSPKDKSLKIHSVKEIPPSKELPAAFDPYLVVCRAFGIRPDFTAGDQGAESEDE